MKPSPGVGVDLATLATLIRAAIANSYRWTAERNLTGPIGLLEGDHNAKEQTGKGWKCNRRCPKGKSRSARIAPTRHKQLVLATRGERLFSTKRAADTSNANR